MENQFIKALKEESAKESVSITENGAIGYSHTRSALTDFFFAVSSMRNWTESEITSKFMEAYAEDSKLATALAFLVRDCRGGMGEKRTFDIIFKWLCKTCPKKADSLIHLIPEYGSWKTVIGLTDAFRGNKKLEETAKKLVMDTILADLESADNNKSVSLLGKWMPSINASSKDTKKLGHYWKNVLGVSEKEYRKILTTLRTASKVVEQETSANKWGEINYNAVPAKAGMKYRHAFLRHDAERRAKWLEDLKSGSNGAKINTSGLTIPELVNPYYGIWRVGNDEDATVEATWKSIVEMGRLDESAPNLIPVVDCSGSMRCPVGNTTAMNVAIGLGLYLANINKGCWRGNIIEFGSRPNFYSVPTESSLLDQYKVCVRHGDCGTTNIRAVFDLVLSAAVGNNLRQDQIPAIVVFSDMEFDLAMECPDQRLFTTIRQKWNAAGYQLPKMYFWNINSRTCTIPVQENDLGVGLISGFSQDIMDMVLSQKLDPKEILVEKLTSGRYDPVLKLA